MLADTCNKIIESNASGVIKINEDQSTYWLKISGEDKNNFVRKVSAQLAKIKMFSFFETKAVMSSFERFEHEKAVLRYLSEMNVNVPHIAYEGPGFFVTSDEGKPLNTIQQSRIGQTELNELFTMFSRLHANNVAHGRPALRDIVINDENNLSLLDFEESILNATSQQMARDMYMLLMDLCRLQHITSEQKSEALLIWKENVSENVWSELLKINRFLKHFSFLARTVLLFKKKNKLSQQILSTIKLLDNFE
ncbi:hypothetical protein [Vibrio viridaestus]|uniref:Serine/threonine protein kinase n=1 Tax=Vibrio viridaestus TaxID=2487322 RepID=A0A3N9TLT7_9VIBR|nr:hypothetical protein [Vibrio viridaestus]RQW64803.1 hypothetical protein EES38_01815 [Vibrio viridaestus]